MAIDLQDVKQVADEIGGRFEEFKKSNDARMQAVESEKTKLSVSVENLNAKLTDLDEYKSRLEKELASLKRPGGWGGEQDPAKTEHKGAFGKFLRKGHEDGLRELEQKALSIGVDADGGFAVPEELDRAIIEMARDESPMRQVCNQVTISTSDYKRLVNLGGASSGWVGETAVRPETGTPTLAQIVATMGEIYANPQATQQSLDDVFFNVEAWLSSEVVREFNEKEAAAFLAGDGTNKPKGILANTLATTEDAVRAFGSIQSVRSGTAGDFDSDKLISLIHKLKRAYRANGTFMLSGTTLFKVRTLKDGQGNYLWQPGLQAGQPSSLAGYSVTENEDMPDVAADSNAVIFGDFRRAYTIVDRVGVRVLRDPYTNKPNVGFYTTKRVGGMLTDSNALKVLTLSV
jgi:HK97 family phage major capsid protein